MRDPRPGRQLAVWAVVAAAVAATAALFGVLRWERRQAAERWSPLMVGNSRAGAQAFARKGCDSCHGTSASGASGSVRAGISEPVALVTAMWNHAPRVWEQIHAGQLPPPAVSHTEMADVFAYLYTVRAVETRGDAEKGRGLFSEKGCVACHGPLPTSGRGLPELARIDSPVAWTAAIWNHPAVPGPAVTFDGRQMVDLFAYVHGGGTTPPDDALLAADADRGQRLFRDKSCARCHAPTERDGRVAPDLGRELPPTLLELAGAMWGHARAMEDAMEKQGMKRPPLDRREVADLVAFLYGVRYAEPGGAPKAGELFFAGHGCDRCHGPLAQGSPSGPALRGRGHRFSAIALAAALWRHGPGMYQQARELGVSWPTLADGDVGDLIAFLNTPPQPGR